MRQPRDSPVRMAPKAMVLALLGIAAALPYAALKVVWVFGGTVGMADPAAFDGPVYLVANVITLGMEMLAGVLLVALAHPVELRLPAWLIVLLAYGAVGLLLPVAGIFLLTGGGSFVASVAGNGLQPWVYTMVYSGFTAQAIVLTILICRYARQRRWNFGGPIAVPVGMVLTVALLVALLVTAAIVQSLWAAGATVGLGDELDRQSGGAFRASSAVHAATSLCAAVGGVAVLAIAPRELVSGRWWPSGLVFFGASACTMWGVYQLVAAIVLGRVEGLFDLVATTRAVCGALLTLVVFALLRRSLREISSPTPEAVARRPVEGAR